MYSSPEHRESSSSDRRTDRRGRPVRLLIGWALLLLLLAVVAPLAQDRFAVPGEVLALVMLAPALAAGLLRLAAPAWFGSFWGPVSSSRLVGPVLWSLLALAVYFGVYLIWTDARPTLPAQIAGVPILVVLALNVIGALGEEIGWRGLAQRTGEHLASPWLVTVLAGILFGATHIGYWPLGPAFMVAFTVSATLMSLTIVVVWRGSLWQRMIPATLIHFGVNLTGMVMPLKLVDAPLWAIPIPGACGLAAVLLGRFLLSVSRRDRGSERRVRGAGRVESALR